MLGEQRISLAHRNGHVAPGLADQPGCHSLTVFEQGLQQMLRRDALVRHTDRDGLRSLKETLGAVGKQFEIHDVPFVCRDMVLLIYNTRLLALGLAGELPPDASCCHRALSAIG